MIASQASFHREQDIALNERGGVSLGKAQRRRSDFVDQSNQPDGAGQAHSFKPASASRRRVNDGATAMSRPNGEPDTSTHDDDMIMLLSDRQWKRIENLPEVGRMHGVGRRPTDDREVLEAVLWVMKHQARWQDLPSDYPSPRTCQRRLRRWQDTGAWNAIWKTYLLSLDDESLSEWGETFLTVALAEVDAKGKNGSTRIGRPPFWFAMARDFWLITWDRQPDELKAKLWDHADELFGKDADLTPPPAVEE